MPQYGRSDPAPRVEVSVLVENEKPADRKAVIEADHIRVGSHESNDLVLQDPHVSRFHCRLVRGQDAWRLEDAGSLNGTRVDGVVARDVDLPEPSCVLELGRSRVRICQLPPTGSQIVPAFASCGDLYGTSLVMQRLFALIDRVSGTPASVLIEGESGTGKELVAAEIVRRGPRASKPFIIVDCSAISPALIESELFGHTRGAFTGADRDRPGAFEAAGGGTVFLDEIGELPIDLQPKLLRVLESREIRRVGETRSKHVDVRVIAATNRLLDREVNRGRFREDLYFRLSVVTVRVPPLRARMEDLELLVDAFLDSLGATDQRHLFTRAVFEDMRKHEWPGNVRELRNYVERTVILREAQQAASHAVGSVPPAGEERSSAAVDLDVPFRDAKERAIAAFERRYLAALLSWAQNNMARASRRARMDRMNLYRLAQRHGLRDRIGLKE